ncbi:MAG: VC_2705 family sodium/solute symporter [Roseiflexaceae bacterium]|nr:VC_2705 family sodium/solute symporter [Roseiflexaceae bacterium]
MVVIALWAGSVWVAIRLLDALFPRLRRGGESEVAEPALQPRLGRPRFIPTVSAPETAPASPAFWRANTRLVLGLLAVWAAVIIVPTLAAPWLNQFELFGFPLGYHAAAQGMLVVFLALIWLYIWRAGRSARLFGATTSVLPSTGTPLIFALFGGWFVTLGLSLVLLDRISTLDISSIGWLLLVVTVAIYAVIGVTNRASSLDDYYVAGRRIPAFFNGLAIGADWMSAASFISMAGTLWLLGYEGLAYIIGWTGGYVLLALLLAPYLRIFGQYTVPDFIAARYEGNAARLVAAVIGIGISFTYLTAQVTGVGIIMSRFLGVNYLAGVLLGLGAVLFCSFLGGMRAITWTQVAQCIVLLIAYLLPVALLSQRETGSPFAQFAYGGVFARIAELEAAQGIANAYAAPFNDWTPANFLALVFCLMLGTAGMPHILTRFYTVPDTGAARQSVGWALLFISLLYFSAPAYAAFARLEILQHVAGQPIDSLPAWVGSWGDAGLLSIQDLNGDGVLQFSELRIDPDLVVLAAPEMAGLPGAVAALVAVGGLAAALSTADGLLMVIAAALSHDLYNRALKQGGSPRARLLFGRAMILVAAVAAALVATRRFAIIVQLVAWAFSFAAATFFPILVLGIFWKRANGRGAVAGMVSGLAVTLSYMLLNLRDPGFNLFGITNVAAGVFGIAANFLVTAVVSLCTPPPPPEAAALVERLRQP